MLQALNIASDMASDNSNTSSNLTLLKDMYRSMVLIHTVEQNLLKLFSDGLIRGTVHTCLGQEATAVGVMGAIDKSKDIVCSNHRGHGHYLAYCNDVEGLIAEILGKSAGVCKGVGGSQHLQRSNFYSNGILGGMAPIASGMAMAEKILNTGAVVVVFMGDGALAEGTVYEAFNMAALWKLPVLFAIEHNGYAQSTPCQLQHAGSIERRGESFGIAITDIDGNDVELVQQQASRIVSEMRAGNSPQIIFLRTYRLGPHSKGDDLRDPAEIAAQQKKAPIVMLASQLDASWCDQIEHEISQKVAAIIASVRSMES